MDLPKCGERHESAQQVSGFCLAFLVLFGRRFGWGVVGDGKAEVAILAWGQRAKKRLVLLDEENSA